MLRHYSHLVPILIAMVTSVVGYGIAMLIIWVNLNEWQWGGTPPPPDDMGTGFSACCGFIGIMPVVAFGISARLLKHRYAGRFMTVIYPSLWLLYFGILVLLGPGVLKLEIPFDPTYPAVVGIPIIAGSRALATAGWVNRLPDD